MSGLDVIRVLLLYVATAVAEIIGCFFPYLWIRHSASGWLLIPAALSLMMFAWLLTFHPDGAGRTYAAYGGVYVTVAILWLWLVERQPPTRWDILGAAMCLVGMMIIVIGARR